MTPAGDVMGEAMGALAPLVVFSVFVFGAMVGSFLNVVIWRLPRGESIVWPGSHCPACEQPIRWYDNLPILSWLLLRGRCRRCGARIDARYVFVEGLTAVLAVACLMAFGPSFQAVRAFVLCALLVALTYIDLTHWLLPHALTWTGIVVGLASAGFVRGGGRDAWVASALGAGLGFAVFWILRTVGTRIFGREALGFGDLFLLAMLGAFLGWEALPLIVFLSSLQGSVVGLVLLATGRGEPGGSEEARVDQATGATEAALGVEGSPQTGEDGAGEEAVWDDEWVPPKGALPFGPFLALAGLEMLFFGPDLMALVARLVGLRGS